MVSNQCNTIIVSTVGVVVIILGSCLGWILFPDIIRSQVVIEEGNAVYDAWIDPSSAGIPVYMKFYIFNLTNAAAVFRPSNPEQPVLQECGPYVYSESRIKTVKSVEDGLITYEENITYFFEEDMSASLDGVISTPNPIYFTVASLIADTDLTDAQKRTISGLINTQLNNAGLGAYMTHPVRELLFEGWDLTGYVSVINGVLNLIPGNPIPPITVPEDFQLRFGYFSTKNGTSAGNFTIESGLNDLHELGFIKKWKNEPQIDVWGPDNNDKYCNMINGTDGAIYPPGLDKNERIYLFNTDLCRSIYGTYERDVTEKGITARRFTIPPEVLDSTSEENICFCRTPDNIDQCFGSGVLDMRQCLLGVPLLMSTPHFLDGDDRYVKAVVGIEPIKEKHETHFDLEPQSSAPLFASKRIQINFDVQPYFVNALKNINSTVFPILWVDESARIDEAGADELKKLINLVKGVDIGRWVFLSCGIVLAVAGITMASVYAKNGTCKTKKNAKVV